MKNLHDTLLFLYELLFPREDWLIACDGVTLQQLEKRMVRVFTDLPTPCVAPLPYRDMLVRNLIQATKFHAHTQAPVLLGETLAGVLSEELAERQMFGTFTEPVFVPIPLHKKRLFERGYNQAELITQSVVKYLGYKEESIQGVLMRTKNTAPQTFVANRSQRLRNLKDAFRVETGIGVVKKDIVLIDDVVTTGATLESARDTLMHAGAKEVLCVAVAH